MGNLPTSTVPCFISYRHFQIEYIGGYTSNSRMKLVNMPPIIGAAMRFIVSEPVPMEYIIGIRPMNIAMTVIILGFMRFTAP